MCDMSSVCALMGRGSRDGERGREEGRGREERGDRESGREGQRVRGHRDLMHVSSSSLGQRVRGHQRPHIQRKTDPLTFVCVCVYFCLFLFSYSAMGRAALSDPLPCLRGW